MADIERLWPEQWAVDAWVKAASIEARMRVASAGLPDDAKRQASVAAIERLLITARAATQQRRWLHWRGLFDRWRGTSVGRAYQSLHAAEIFLVDLLPDEEIDALIPRILVRDTTDVDGDDPRRAQIDQLLQATAKSKRAAVKSALTYSYDVSDQAYVRVRDFRNVLLVSAVLVTFLMSGFVILVGLNPSTVPFCFTPGQTTASTDAASGAATVCPSGKSAPSPTDVRLIAGLGLLGGALSAAFSIRNIRGTSLPYGIPIALSLLKVPSGALTAVAAILLLGGDFIPGLSELDSQRQILAYALVFGYAQQIATRLLDQRAQGILESVPSKEPEPAGSRPSAGSASVATAGARAAEATEATGDAASLPRPSPAAEDEPSFPGMEADVPGDEVIDLEPGPPIDAEPVDLVVADDEEAVVEPPDGWDPYGHEDRDRSADVIVKGE
jgi:hypothetical protein